CNKNAVPFDTEKPTVTSGLRFGSSAATTRGFGVAEFRLVGAKIVQVLDGLARDPTGNGACEAAVQEDIRALTKRFPIY
ncbi:MAG: serine hydroxymethyltransferase, partial [Proteobacteria bacterium]|nr:serine hydroxymethyltransferase [Pseudomonadota bacterium]